MSHYGSRLGVINGETGNWLTNLTGDVFQLFENLDGKGNVCKFENLFVTYMHPFGSLSYIVAPGYEQN